MAFAATASKRGARSDMDKPAINVAKELGRLSALTIFELRGEWRRLHRTPPPMRLSRDLLTRGITYKLQERGYGGLSLATWQDHEGDALLHHFVGLAGQRDRTDDPRSLGGGKLPALGHGHGLSR